MTPLFELKIGGTTFNLKLSSEKKPPSLFSVNYTPEQEADWDNEEDLDTVVQLGNFSGTLCISKSISKSVIDNDNTSTKIQNRSAKYLDAYTEEKDVVSFSKISAVRSVSSELQDDTSCVSSDVDSNSLMGDNEEEKKNPTPLSSESYSFLPKDKSFNLQDSQKLNESLLKALDGKKEFDSSLLGDGSEEKTIPSSSGSYSFLPQDNSVKLLHSQKLSESISEVSHEKKVEFSLEGDVCKSLVELKDVPEKEQVDNNFDSLTFSTSIKNQSLSLSDFPKELILDFDKPVGRISNITIHTNENHRVDMRESDSIPSHIFVGSDRQVSALQGSSFSETDDAKVKETMKSVLAKNENDPNLALQSILKKNRPLKGNRRVSFAGFDACEVNKVNENMEESDNTYSDTSFSFLKNGTIDDDNATVNSSLNKILKSFARRRDNTLRQTTRLHVFCAKEGIKVEKLNHILNLNPAFASVKDMNGRLPLHIIADNEDLLFGRRRKEFQGFVKILIKSYPDALYTVDDNERVPFTTSLENWVLKEEHENIETDASIITQVTSERSIWTQSSPSGNIFPMNVMPTQIVEWSLKILSRLIQTDEGNEHFDEDDDDISVHSSRRSLVARIKKKESIVENFSSIPNILKTILLIADDSTMYRILDRAIIQRALLNTDLIGPWIVDMLKSSDKCERVIDYFELISSLSITNAFDLKRRPRLSDNRKFFSMREDLIKHIANLDGLLRSLFKLENNVMSRACSTYAVQRILDMNMLKTSLATLMIFEFVLNFFLVIAFYVHCEILNMVSSNRGLLFYQSPWLFVLWVCIYFLTFNDLLNIMLMQSYQKIIKRYLTFWVFIETSSLILAVITIFASFFVTPLSLNLLVLVKSFLWLRFFACLKGVNMQLATFVLSMTEMFKKLRWFSITFLTICFLFSDMVSYIFRYGGLCTEDSPDEKDLRGDYCSTDHMRNFLRGYAIIVGDVDLDQYREKPSITILWVFFTCIGVIILLNMLIAIVNNSYEKSSLRQLHFFGMARIPILAKHTFIESTAQSIRIGTTNRFRMFFHVAILWCVVLWFLLSFLWFLQIFWFFENEKSSFMKHISNAFMFTLSFILVTSFVIVLVDFLQVKLFDSLKGKSKIIDFFIHWTKKIDFGVANGLLGIAKNRFDDYAAHVEYQNEFGGMTSDILKRTKEVVDEAEARIKDVVRDLIKTLENEVHTPNQTSYSTIDTANRSKE